MRYNVSLRLFCKKSDHIFGWNKINNGNNSNLPASMSNISTHFEKLEKKLKLAVGPTSSKPGPILLMVAATAVKFVTKSFPSNEIRSTEVQKIRTKMIQYSKKRYSK